MSWTDDDVAGPAPAWTDADVVSTKRAVTPLGERIQTGLMDPIVGAAQLMDKAINPVRQFVSPGATSMEDVVRERDANYQAPEGIDFGRAVGTVANPMSWAGGTGTLKLSLAQLAKLGAGAGAAQAALGPTAADLSGSDFATEKAKSMAIGGTIGAALPFAARGLREGFAPLNPIKPTREAQALMAQGVQPTVGQARGGWANSVEQKLTAVPIIGDVIQGARNRAQDDFQKVALQRAMTGSTDVPGKEYLVANTVEEANKVASQLYEDVVPHLKPHQDVITKSYEKLQEARANPQLTKEGRKILSDLTKSYFDGFGKREGATIKQLDSQIGYDIRKYAAGDPNHQAIADGLMEVQRGFREGLESGLPAEFRGALKDANQIFRNLIPFNKAASARADEKVLPRALQRALARQSRTDASRFADDLIDPAVSVLPNTVPDSGTAGRMLLGLGTLGGGAVTGLLPLATAGAIAAPAALGATRTGQKALLGGYNLGAKGEQLSPQMARFIAAMLRGEENQ